MATVPQCLLHKVYRKDAVKGELSHKGRERDKTMAIHKSHTSYIRNCRLYCEWNMVEITLESMLLLLLTLFYCGKLRHRAINLFAQGYGRCVAEAWNRPKSTKSLLGACSWDFPLFASGYTATPEARQDVCNWSGFKRIFGISQILDCASVIFIYPCMSWGLSEIAILLFIFITLNIDFFSE